MPDPITGHQKVCLYCSDCKKVVACCDAFWLTDTADNRDPIAVVDGKVIWGRSRKENALMQATEAAMQVFYKHLNEVHI